MPEGADTRSNGPAAAMLWEEERRLLSRQEAALDTLRTQAVAILSVGALVAGLFGSHIVPGHHHGLTEVGIVVALVLFAISVVLSLAILRPRTWTFDQTLAGKLKLIEQQKMLGVDALNYSWTADFEPVRTANQIKLDRLVRCFAWACLLTGAQVLAWGVALL